MRAVAILLFGFLGLTSSHAFYSQNECRLQLPEMKKIYQEQGKKIESTSFYTCSEVARESFANFSLPRQAQAPTISYSDACVLLIKLKNEHFSRLVIFDPANQFSFFEGQDGEFKFSSYKALKHLTINYRTVRIDRYNSEVTKVAFNKKNQELRIMNWKSSLWKDQYHFDYIVNCKKTSK